MNFFGKKINVPNEIERRYSQRMRILLLLKRERQVTTQDLQRIAFNYTMRISELRKDGHKILAEYIRPGVYRYTYKGKSVEKEAADVA